ncbi:restriction endonuclease subunit S [Falsiroseomonas sp. CW058]|uniref:restriction endonuclease subunit S n=1 Tax=Falsiroseomonas sp. CW058 TaxID=3388664 RepID=UPI003D3186F4
MDALPREGLPPGWGAASLETICEINPSTDISAISGDTAITFVPMAAVGALTNTVDTNTTRPLREITTGFTRFRSGDVIFAKITPCMENGKIALVPELPQGIGIGSTEFHVVRPKPGIDAAYVCYYLMQESFRATARSSMSGAVGQQRVPATFLREAVMPVPPAAEQTRIVAAVNALFEEVEAGEAALARAREGLTQFRASLLHAACTGALTADWRAENPADSPPEQLLAAIAEERARKVAKRYRDAETPEGPPPFDLPPSWGWATVDQLCWKIDYGSSARCRPLPDGVPVLRMGNIQNGRLDYAELKHLPRDHNEFPDLLLERGDLLFNRTNSAELVGKTAVFEGHDRPVSFASYIVRAKAVHVRSPFLAHYINSPLGRQWIASVMTQQVGQANVSGGRLRTLCVPVPPLLEQDEIITRVADCLDVARDAALGDPFVEEAAQLRQSILHAAFTGRLVPQDPADEPAAALLARLRATPAASRRPRARRTATQPDLIETPA